MKIKELLNYAEYGITVYFVFEDVVEMEYCFDKNSSLSEADMEVLNMEPSKIWGWDDGTVCIEVKMAKELFEAGYKLDVYMGDKGF